MPAKQVIFLLVFFALIAAWIFSLIIRNELRETYAVMWVVILLCIPAAIILYPLLFRLSRLLGFIAPVNLSYVLGFFVVFVLSVHFTVLNSHMHRTLKNLVQKVALLEEEIRKLAPPGPKAGTEIK